MFLVISNILSSSEVKAIRDIAGHLPFRDGKETAGGQAARVKKNSQAARNEEVAGILASVDQRLSNHAVFTSATRPKQFVNMLLSRYDVGDAYDGGSLMIQDTLETRQIKLEAGDLILYPSTTLHQVEPVTRGQRLVIVGWVQSLVARADQREILFDLDRAIADIESKDASEAQNLLYKTRSNLLRQWIDC